MTNFNERTHFFIKIYVSHTLFSRGLMFLSCERDEWRQGQTAILTQLLLLTIAASWLGLLNRGRWGPQPSVCKLALTLAFPSPTLNCRRHLPLFFHNAHLLPLLLPLIYTGASLIDGSVKDQYIITAEILFNSSFQSFYHTHSHIYAYVY